MDGIDGKEEWMGDGKGRRREEEVEGVYILLRLAAGAPSAAVTTVRKERKAPRQTDKEGRTGQLRKERPTTVREKVRPACSISLY